MKYDPEYNSYKFSNNDLDIIVNALYFYSQHSPSVQQENIGCVNNLIQQLEKTKSIVIDQ